MLKAIAERVPGVRLQTIPDHEVPGAVDTEASRVLLREGKGRAIVAVMLANNETGALQPLADGGERSFAKEAGALLLNWMQSRQPVSSISILRPWALTISRCPRTNWAARKAPAR